MQQVKPKSCCQKFKEYFIKPPQPQTQSSIENVRINQPEQQTNQVNEWPLIEEQFINKIILKSRQKMFIEFLQKNRIISIEKLMLSFQNSKSSSLGRRCQDAEFFILQQMYLNFNTAQITLVWQPQNANLISNENTQILQQPRMIIKNILLVGTTGQGKSTLINSFYNYIQGIRLGDNIRFMVINEDHLNRTGQSVTRKVDQYKMQIENDLIFNFIDTPGLADTQGFERDQAIIDQISQQLQLLHEKKERIHQVIIVSQLSTNYVVANNSHTLQQLALLSVLKLFGLDMAQNYIHALTFSDFTSIHRNNFENSQSIFYVLSQRDYIMQTQNISNNIETQNMGQNSPINDRTTLLQSVNQINEIPLEYCQFQNSVYFSHQSDIISNIQFRRNQENYTKFKNKIASCEGFTLDTTIQVIQERKKLKNQIDYLGTQLQLRIKIDKIIQSNKAKIANYGKIVEENKIFYYTDVQNVIKPIQCGNNIYMTNCNKCERTCHKNCQVSNINLKNCNVMIKNSQNQYICESCLHPVEVHQNQNFEYVLQTIETKKNYEDMKQEYDRASTQAEILLKMQEKEDQKEKENDMNIQVILDDLRKCFNVLFSSALYKLDLKEKSLKDFLYRYYKDFENQLEKYFKQEVDIFATRQFLQNMPLNQQSTLFRLSTNQFQQVQ